MTSSLGGALHIPFGVQDLLPAHRADSLFVSAGLAVVRPLLVHLLSAYPTRLQLLPDWIKPFLRLCQGFVLVYLP